MQFFRQVRLSKFFKHALKQMHNCCVMVHAASNDNITMMIIVYWCGIQQTDEKLLNLHLKSKPIITLIK